MVNQKFCTTLSSSHAAVRPVHQVYVSFPFDRTHVPQHPTPPRTLARPRPKRPPLKRRPSPRSPTGARGRCARARARARRLWRSGLTLSKKVGDEGRVQRDGELLLGEDAAVRRVDGGLWWHGLTRPACRLMSVVLSPGNRPFFSWVIAGEKHG